MKTCYFPELFDSIYTVFDRPEGFIVWEEIYDPDRDRWEEYETFFSYWDQIPEVLQQQAQEILSSDWQSGHEWTLTDDSWMEYDEDQEEWSLYDAFEHRCKY